MGLIEHFFRTAELFHWQFDHSFGKVRHLRIAYPYGWRNCTILISVLFFLLVIFLADRNSTFVRAFSESKHVNYVVPIGVATLVFLFGQFAYFRRRDYDQFRDRYLIEGTEALAEDFEYALAVCRSNLVVLLRVNKMVRDSGDATDYTHLVNGFVEYDQNRFRMRPITRVNELLQDDALARATDLNSSHATLVSNFLIGDYSAGVRFLFEASQKEGKVKSLEERKQFLIRTGELRANQLSTNLKKLQEMSQLIRRISAFLAVGPKLRFHTMSRFRLNPFVLKEIAAIEEAIEEYRNWQEKVDNEESNQNV